MKTPQKFPVTIKEGFARVKIYRLPQKDGSFIYSVDWRMDGKRHRKAFSVFAEAKIKAEAAVKQLASGDATALQLNGMDRATYVRAMEVLKPSGVPLDIAATHFAEAVKTLGSDLVMEAAREYAKRHPRNMPQKTVAQVVSEMIEAKTRANRSQRHLADLRQRCGAFAEAFHCPILSITGVDIRAYLEKKQVAPRTIRNLVGSLANLFEFARNRGYLPKDFDALEGIELPAIPPGNIEIFTPKEITAILSAASPDILPILAIGAFAGLRSQEIQRLEWAEIRLAERFIEVKAAKAKTARRRLVPISNNLAQWLAPYAGHQGQVWKGGRLLFFQHIEEAAKAAGVRWKRNAMRHSFISHRLAEIQNAAQVALEAGNSPSIIFANYRELVTPTQAAAWFAVSPKQPANVITATPQAAIA